MIITFYYLWNMHDSLDYICNKLEEDAYKDYNYEDDLFGFIENDIIDELYWHSIIVWFMGLATGFTLDIFLLVAIKMLLGL